MNEIHDVTDSAAPEQLAKVDLNLLVAFDALARERSVTRAARRTGVTQSAMSHALARLRELLGDPLLLRGRSGMVLTPRAEALIVPLRSGLVTLGRALAQPDGFSPAQARRSFRMASPDLFDVLAIPPLLERIRREAPGVDIAVTPLHERRLAEVLETGEVDVAIVPQLARTSTEAEPPSQGLLRRRLFRDRFLCLLRARHPALTRKPGPRSDESRPRLSLAAFAKLSHVLVSPTGAGRGFVDELLAERGLQRRIALRIPHFYSALAIVAKSDLVLTAPSALASLATAEQDIVAASPPLPLPEHSVNLVWHERYAKDAGHTWLRELITEVARGVA